jgi:hypothetical protein
MPFLIDNAMIILKQFKLIHLLIQIKVDDLIQPTNRKTATRMERCCGHHLVS